MKRLQYQQKAEVFPLGGSWKEKILLDKWQPDIPEMYLKKKSVLSLYTQYNTPYVPVPVIYADRWQPKFPDYFRKKVLSTDKIGTSCIDVFVIPQSVTLLGGRPSPWEEQCY